MSEKGISALEMKSQINSSLNKANSAVDLLYNLFLKQINEILKENEALKASIEQKEKKIQELMGKKK